jgi:hypothetical protein
MKPENPNTSFFGLGSVLTFPAARAQAPTQPLQNLTGLLSRGWRWIQARQAIRSKGSRLQVASTVSLGEKRFAAVLQVDGQQFLVGGSSTNVVLLAQLNPQESFDQALQETTALAVKQPIKRTKKQIEKPQAGQTRRQA